MTFFSSGLPSLECIDNFFPHFVNCWKRNKRIKPVPPFGLTRSRPQRATLTLSFPRRISWKAETCETPFRSCSRSSSRLSKPTVLPLQLRLCRTEPLPLQRPQRRRRTKIPPPRASRHTTRPPATETLRPRPFLKATSPGSSPVSWVKVRAKGQAWLPDFPLNRRSDQSLY